MSSSGSRKSLFARLNPFTRKNQNKHLKTTENRLGRPLIERLEDRLAPANNIRIQTGGMGMLPAGASDFNDTADYTIDPGAINGAATDVFLRANNDITFLNDVNVAAAGV